MSDARWLALLALPVSTAALLVFLWWTRPRGTRSRGNHRR